jgi:putative oxidoreductase
MQDMLDEYGPLTGRILISLIFILSGISKIDGFANTAAYMASKGLPMVDLLLAASIVIEVGGALMILVGYKARLGAMALFLWMVPVTFIMHNFWSVPADQHLMQQIMFLKNMAMMGAMLFIMVFGPGPMSVDKK